MFHNRRASLTQHAAKMSVSVSPFGDARISRGERHSTSLSIALTHIATSIQWLSPMVGALVPEKALLMCCLASGIRALARRIAGFSTSQPTRDRAV
ncbi:hypothetical protein SAMN05444167_0485 [Terriglobus roseus]|uniref:Uncharacterized protein n=1 Tax=Terriglobus roseus TaxID=392734 RepID=A0A1G7FXG8_9BACT|nr:hypothetical protein SAMN05444167_0485 [Terriglobus roseus]